MGLLPENSLLPVTANAKMLAQSLKARQQPRTQLTGQGLLDTAAIGLSPVPFIGDALGLAADASRFYNEPESRTPLNFGLAALGLIPFVPPLVSAGLGKFAQSQGKTLTAPSMTGPARNQAGAIVYHGSPHKFDQFNVNSKSANDMGLLGNVETERSAAFLSNNPNFSKEYGDVTKWDVKPKKTAKITPELRDEFVGTIDPFGPERDLWLQAKYGSRQDWSLFEGELGKRFSNFLLDKGYDAAKFKEYIPTKDGGEVGGVTTAILKPDIARIVK